MDDQGSGPDGSIRWEYNMRREMQEILPSIFIGPYSCAKRDQLAVLQAAGITEILCVRHESEVAVIRHNFPEHFKYETLEMADSPREGIIHLIPRVSQYIDGIIARGGKLLLVSYAGISRCGALLIGYLIQQKGMSFGDACQVVQSRRFCISPNEGFLTQLREFEFICRAKEQTAAMGGSGSGRKKRVYEMNDDDDDGM